MELVLKFQSLTNYWRTLWKRRNVTNSDEKMRVKSLETKEVYSIIKTNFM